MGISDMDMPLRGGLLSFLVVLRTSFLEAYEEPITQCDETRTAIVLFGKRYLDEDQPRENSAIGIAVIALLKQGLRGKDSAPQIIHVFVKISSAGRDIV